MFIQNLWNLCFWCFKLFSEEFSNIFTLSLYCFCLDRRKFASKPTSLPTSLRRPSSTGAGRSDVMPEPLPNWSTVKILKSFRQFKRVSTVRTVEPFHTHRTSRSGAYYLVIFLSPQANLVRLMMAHLCISMNKVTCCGHKNCWVADFCSEAYLVPASELDRWWKCRHKSATEVSIVGIILVCTIASVVVLSAYCFIMDDQAEIARLLVGVQVDNLKHGTIWCRVP